MDRVADRPYDCVINVLCFMRLEVRIPPDAPTVEVAMLHQIPVIATARLGKPKPLCFLHAKCFIYYSSLQTNPQRWGLVFDGSYYSCLGQHLNWGGGELIDAIYMVGSVGELMNFIRVIGNNEAPLPNLKVPQKWRLQLPLTGSLTVCLLYLFITNPLLNLACSLICLETWIESQKLLSNIVKHCLNLLHCALELPQLW